MGYTHYWRGLSRVNPETYQGTLQDVRKVLGGCQALLSQQLAGNVERLPDLSEAADVFVNGRGDESCETFWLPVDPSKTVKAPDDDFQFCKTRQRPYDLAVTAALAVLADGCPEVKVSSDGSIADWAAGCEYASRILGREVPVPIHD